MENVLIFGGTSEGRRLSEHLSAQGFLVHVCVATEYGEEVLPKREGLIVHSGRLTEPEMEELLREREWKAVVDATHPYAVEVSKNIKLACEAVGNQYFRLLREPCQKQGEPAQGDNPGQQNEAGSTECSQMPVYVDSREEAAAILNRGKGNILFTTGSKELGQYRKLIKDPKRIYARILPNASMIEECRDMGLSGKQIICMQGPFSAQLNDAMLRQVNARFLVTKDTGAAGGFAEKLMGARRADAQVLVIRRPGGPEQGKTMEELLDLLGVAQRKVMPQGSGKEVTLIGIGMGAFESMTKEAVAALAETQVILGARRMLNAVEHFQKPMVSMYKTAEILEFIETQPYQRYAVVLSGDVGFYSGAGKLREAIREKGYEFRLICGISSVVYFCSRLGMAWEDVTLMSMHGREQNLAGAVRIHEKVFSLAGKADDIRKLSQELILYGLKHVTMHVGTQLSYPDETVQHGSPVDFLQYDRKGLCVLLIENPGAGNTPVVHGLPDESFIRGKVPMTKEEVRSISISKLQLTQNAIVYDIGAGTGSVAVECALMAPKGTVYAIEKKEDALKLLWENKYAHQAANLNIVAGTAPEALKELPAPTHVFIGGSSGRLSDIVGLLVEKNPEVRIVINAIALETLGEITRLLQERNPRLQDIVQVSAARAKELMGYHMMMGLNPVYIVTIQGGME